MAYTITNIRRGRSNSKTVNSISPNTFGVTYADLYDEGRFVMTGTIEMCKGKAEMLGMS